MLIGAIAMPIHYLTVNKNGIVKSEYFSELYGGTKDTHAAKIYHILFVYRRLVSAIVIVCLKDIDVYAK